MNEIEKLYENAGINQVCNTCELRGFKRLCPTKELCVRVNPPFTAEKQLELIKWLAVRFNSDYMTYWRNGIKDVWIFRLYDLTELSSEEPYIYEGRNKNFTKALCNLINNLWQDLTEEECKQIKEILK